MLYYTNNTVKMIYYSKATGTKTLVRLVVVVFALVVMAMYALLHKPAHTHVTSYTPRGLFGHVYAHALTPHTQRHLLSMDGYRDDNPQLLGDSDQDNCTDPRGSHEGYNNSCDFVLDQCSDEAALVNYLSFVLCNLANVKVRV